MQQAILDELGHRTKPATSPRRVDAPTPDSPTLGPLAGGQRASLKAADLEDGPASGARALCGRSPPQAAGTAGLAEEVAEVL